MCSEWLGPSPTHRLRPRTRAQSCLLARISTLFDEWRDWCEANGRKEAGTAASFGRDLRAAVTGLRVKQRRGDEGRARVYEGIGIGTTLVSPMAQRDDVW